MTASPETPQRDNRLCGASTHNGYPCRRPAGWGTGHVGFGTCKLHGGSTPASSKHAEILAAEHRRAEALELLRAQGVEPVTDPVAALRDVAGESRVLAAATRQAFAETADRDGMEATAGQPIAAMYSKTLDQTGKLLARMAELGITPDRTDALPALRSAAMLAAIAEAWRYGADGVDLAETIHHCLEDDYTQEVPTHV